MPSTSTAVRGTDFVVVWTKNLDAAIDFYGEVVGLAAGPLYGSGVGAEFETGNLTIALMDPAKVGSEFSTSTPIALRVDDVAATRAELESQGVNFVAAFDSGVCHQAIFHDPDGNPLILHHRYAPKGE